MGISDDIVPSFRPHRDHGEPNHIRHIDSHQDDHEHDLNFIDAKDEKKPIDDSSPADSFFAAKEIEKNKPEETNKSNNLKKMPGLVVSLLLIGLLGYLIAHNYQRIKSLVSTSTPKVASSSTDNKSSQTTNLTSEIKPQDYTTPTTDSTTATTASPSTSATTASTVDKTSFKVQVLNGNGITNSASSIKKVLETAGFTVSSTGNAKNFSYDQTYVYYKTGKENGAEIIKTLLQDRTVTTQNADAIVKTYDIVVVVGKK